MKNEQDDANEVMVNLLTNLDVSQGQIAELLNSKEDKAEYKTVLANEDFFKIY